MFSGTTDDISVRTDNKQTIIYLNNEMIGKGDAFVNIPKKGAMVFSAKLPNCTTAYYKIKRSFDPLTLLGIFIDYGLISILIVDTAITGAVTKATSTSVYLSPQCD